MDFRKWEAVVIEWVNCLKLSKPIQSIKDLNNGLFLSSLFKLLKRDESNTPESLTSIIKFLKEQYPNFIFKYLDNLTIQDLQQIDLLTVSSLLLHYACIFDRRDVLTSPLCHKLSQTTQVSIRSFLEKMKNQITKEELFDIIINQCNAKTESVQTYRLQAGDSFLLCGSPLQDLLQTPPSKAGRLQEKDKQITKLRYEIDMERFEKTDLQGELDVLKERNKKLTQQMTNKTSEIIKLRTEISDLENKTLENYQDNESRELQRRLRGEIDSLEKYIAQLQEEQDKLYNERDSIKERLKKVEGQYMIWHDKALSNEQNYDNLLEKHQQQDVEVQHLRSQCLELNALLEELRAARHCNESVEVDVSGLENGKTFEIGASSEDLACAVVEVQLRDAQKENTELNNLLKDSQENARKLQEELVNIKNSYAVLQNDYESLRKNNNELLEKVSILTETQTQLKNTRKKLEQASQEISNFIQQNAVLNSDIINLQKQVKESDAKVTTIEIKNKNLNDELAIHQNNYTRLETLFVQKTEKCEALEERVSIIQTEYDNLLDRYKEQDFKLQSVTKNFDELTLNMEQSLQKIEKFVFGNNSINIKNTNVAFEKIFNQLEQNHTSQLNEKEKFSKSLCDFEELVLKLKTDLGDLNEKQIINLEERELLSRNLKCAEEQILVLENTITDHVNKIQSLNCIIFEMRNTISDLEILKDVVEGKENIIVDLEAATNSLEIKLTKSNNELAQTKVIQEDLHQSLENLEKIKNDFEEKILETQKELAEHKENEGNLNKTIAELHALTSVFKQQISETTEELNKYQENEEKLQKTLENLEGLKTSLEHQLNDANDKILEQKTKEKILEMNILDQDKLYHENIKALSSEVEGYNKQINELELELQECKLNTASAEKDLEVIAKSKQSLQEEIEICKITFDKRIGILDATIHKLEGDLQTAVNEKYYIQEEFEKKFKECEKLTLEKNQDVSRYGILQEELKETVEKLALKESACTDKEDLLSKVNQDLLKLKLDLEHKTECLCNLEASIKERDCKIEELTDSIVAMDERNKDLSNKTAELQGECLILEKIKTKLEIKCTQLETNGWNIISELSLKNKQLDDLIEKSKRHQEEKEDEKEELTNALSKSQSELQEITGVKNILIVENKKQIDDLQNNILELNQIIVSLNNQEVQYFEEIHRTKDELSDTVKKYTESLQIRQEMETDNELQVNNLTENLHELIEKYNSLDKTHMETLMELKQIQGHVEVLENSKIQLEGKLIEQKTKYDEDYEKCIMSLNDKICDLVKEETELKTRLIEITEKLKNSEENNDDLNESFNKISKELSLLKEEKTLMCQNLSHFNDSYQELKNMYGSLKLIQAQFIGENNQNLNMLQTELSEQIGALVEENGTLKDTIKELEENLNILQTQQDEIKSMQANKLEQKEEIIKTLENDNKSFKAHIKSLIQEKQIVQEQIALEVEKLEELDQENQSKILEHEENIIKLKCANDILETGNVKLQEEMEIINGKIEELEQGKINDKKRFDEDIQSREEEIKNFQEQIGFLQSQVSENVSKNTELMLELCTVNESLNSLSKQHQSLQQILTEEKQTFTVKLLQAENDSTDKQNILENLKSENQILSQEIITAKKEMENLKDELKSHLIERQTLELQIKTASEKILGQDSVIRRHEAAISEANTKVLGKLEEIFELEKEKRALQEKLERLSKELDKAKRNRDDILDSQAKIIKETENNLIRAHENAIEVKNDLLKRIELVENEKINEKQLRNDLEKLLEGEKVAKEILEIRVLELNNEKSKFSQLFSTLKHSMQSLYCALIEKPIEIFTDGETKELQIGDIESVNDNIQAIKERIVEVMEQTSLYTKQILILENEKLEITEKIKEISYEKELINEEKDNLVRDYGILYNEKIDREQEFTCLKETQLAHDLLKAKYEQLSEYNKNNENVNSKNLELQETLIRLEKKSAETYNTLKKYAGYSSTYKTAIEKLITERNVVDNTLNNLKQNLSVIQMKMLQVSDDREHSRLMEQVHSFEIVSEDIQKQFLRISRKIHEIIFMVIEVPADVYDVVTSEKISKAEDVFDKIDFEEELEKVVDCRDRATDLLDQMATFECSLATKLTKVQKENVLRSSNTTNIEVKVKDEELKKRNAMLKQRLTLAEYAKTNLEKKIKQLRQENKILNSRSENPVPLDNDANYTVLLQDHKQVKEEYEKYKSLYNKLQKQYEESKAKQKFIPEQIRYEKYAKTEQDVKVEGELIKLREAYGNLMSDNSKLDLENATMRKLLEDRTAQLSELKLMKESYEKLLEENNKLRMELDTIKYKRNRDREALMEAVKKDRNESKKLQEVRTEYEAKLEKMKEKMVQLYREEIDKEAQKNQRDQTEKTLLLKTIDQLKQNLKEEKLENQKNSECRNCEFCTTRSYCTIPDVSQTSTTAYHAAEDSLQFKSLIDAACDRSSISRRKVPEDRKYATLPRSTGMGVIEENAVLKRNTLSSVPPGLGQNLVMEDEEEDLFNNKYLDDLKQGRCVMSNDRESMANRLSQLKWRNSLCPPHLKSSYPAETQFNSPRQFKDEELKLGTDFDDSMSTKLIPGDKPRKKDFGTTSYKKPGPPTPSKNGGRLSLQGNEPQPREVLREQNETKTPKRTTPSRIKALFMGRNASVRDNSEVGQLCTTSDTFDTLPLTQLVYDTSPACKNCCESCVMCNSLLMQRCGRICILKQFLRKHARVCFFLCVIAVGLCFNEILWDSIIT